jgi:hypothetical protein
MCHFTAHPCVVELSSLAFRWVLSQSARICRVTYAFAEVVSAAVAHAHAALTSFPESLRLVSPSAEGQSFGHDSVCGMFALHSQDQRRSLDRTVLVTLAQRVSLDPSRCVR